MRDWICGLILPKDDECGLFGFWIDTLNRSGVRVQIIMRPTCGWLWGYENNKLLSMKGFGLGPLGLVYWGRI